MRVAKVNILAFFMFSGVILSAQNWSTLGGGIPQALGGLRVIYADTFDNYIYAAGTFDSVDGIHTSGIARWDGLAWDSLGSGVGPNYGCCPIYAITRYNNELYVGGSFYSLGNVPAERLGKWNGSNWDTLIVQPFANNYNGAVKSLTEIDNELYVGGSFDSVIGQPCQSIARWNGSTWNLLGLPPIIRYDYGPVVLAICKYNGEIYFGGNFESYQPLNEDTVMDIIRWDGVNWKSVGGGMRGVWSGINKMVVYNGELYVAGSFFEFESNPGNNIQKWNGTQWTEVGGGTWGPTILNGQIFDMYVHNNKLYVVGQISIAGGIPADRVAVWDGINWCGLGSTFDNGVQSLCFYQDTMYVGGGFWTIDGDTILKIAQWTGGTFVDQCGNNAGIDNENIEVEIMIFPNPTEQNITISISNEMNFNYPIAVSVINSIGQRTFIGNQTENYSQYDISFLAKGYYYIEINLEGNRIYKKLIKL